MIPLYVSPLSGGDVDCRANDQLHKRGIVQAEHLGAFLSSPPSPLPVPDMLFSSPFYRCIQTAQPLAKAMGKPIHCEHGIAEWCVLLHCTY